MPITKFDLDQSEEGCRWIGSDETLWTVLTKKRDPKIGTFLGLNGPHKAAWAYWKPGVGIVDDRDQPLKIFNDPAAHVVRDQETTAPS